MGITIEIIAKAIIWPYLSGWAPWRMGQLERIGLNVEDWTIPRYWGIKQKDTETVKENGLEPPVRSEEGNHNSTWSQTNEL